VLNILFNSDLSKVSGPTKVVNNLIKGLDIIKYPYLLNKEIIKGHYIYMPNGASNLLGLKKKYKNKIIIGPNIIDLPYYGKISRILRNKIKYTSLHVLPSNWYEELYKLLHFDLTKTDVWPVGIDTDEFIPFMGKKKDTILIYTKNRNPNELKEIERILTNLNLNYWIINYNKGYTEAEFKYWLAKSIFILWHSCQETQGIAYQECLSSNVPLLVYDIKEVYKNDKFYSKFNKIYELSNKVNISSVPYFDKRCGAVIYNISELKGALNEMMDIWHTFEPRNYILDNLSLEKQTKELLYKFENTKDVNFSQTHTNELREFKLPILYHFLNKIRIKV